MHFLSRQNRDLAVLFGQETDDQIDKFNCCDWFARRREYRS